MGTEKQLALVQLRRQRINKSKSRKKYLQNFLALLNNESHEENVVGTFKLIQKEKA